MSNQDTIGQVIGWSDHGEVLTWTLIAEHTLAVAGLETTPIDTAKEWMQ